MLLDGGLLAGKVAIVAGIGPGLGREVALLFARNGASVVLGARKRDESESVAAEIAKLDGAGSAHVVTLDITDDASCHAAVEAATGTFGRVDILVNNAFTDGDHTAFLDADLDRWRQAMELNLFGTLQMTRAAVPAMQELKGQGGGRVVMINSMSAWRLQPNMGAYTISKAALESATKMLALELGPHGIRVNGVHPGYIWGPSLKFWFKHLAKQRGITPEEVYDEVAAETCLGYLAPPEEIAGSVLFMASDLSAPVTGQSLGVNAGHWMH